MTLRLGIVLCLLVAPGSLLTASENGYPRAELLLEPTELAKPDVARGFVVLDARKRAQYDEARIPAAVWVDAAAWAKAFGDGKDAKGWSAKIGGLGIGPEAKVVVYDDSSLNDAARMWWILRYWGVKDVRLLNGNWLTWKKEKLPVQSGKPKPPHAVPFAAESHAKRLATRGLLLDSLKTKSLQIVDARSEKEFCGIDKKKNKRGGAIPGARHLEWTDLIDKATQRFKSPDQLRKLFRDAGVQLDGPTATYCQSGGRASVMFFGMELMGANDVRNYYASWGEWGNDEDTPIVAPEQGKKQ